MTKCLSEWCWGANEYELRKFNLADTVTLSRSVFRVIRSLDRMGADAAARTCEKDGFPMRGHWQRRCKPASQVLCRKAGAWITRP